MKSYFFIPANNKKFLSKVAEIDADHIIIDLEDAIFNSSLNEAVENILSFDLSRDYYIRLAYNVDDPEYLNRLITAGYSKFVVPKLNFAEEMETFISLLHDQSREKHSFELILLVESATALFHLSEIIQFPIVKSVSLGSHDYCASIGMEHTLDNLYWARMQTLNTARAFHKEVIDIASINLTNEDEFIAECKAAISKGYDGKFILHPWQLKLFNEIAHYSDEEIEFAKKVKQHIHNLGGVANFTIAKIEGKVVEKPHLNRINQILKTIGDDTL